ncbi:MAG: hypothetical protein ACK5X3_06715, partial [Pseudomonadota bacterium]
MKAGLPTGHRWWPLNPAWSPARHPESGSHRHPPDRGTLPTMTLSFAPDAIETWPLSRLQPYAKNAK